MKKNTQKRIVYFRFVFPIIAALLIFLLMFVPCYRYITVDTGLGGTISLWELAGNSWDTAREYLFGATEKNEVTENFARILLGVVIALFLFFCIGVVSTVYSAVVAFRYFANGCAEGKSRLLFITLTFNRIVLCVYHAFLLSLFILPHVMPYLYDNALNYHVELDIKPFDMLYVAIAVYAFTVILIAVSRKYECALRMNVYKKQYEESAIDTENDGEARLENNIPSDPYEAMAQREREEQNERILRLLQKQKEEDE